MTAPAQHPTVLAHDRQGAPGRTPVVLIHAGIADRRMWQPLWEGLTAERDVVRLPRGFGESGHRPDGAVDHVADVGETLDRLGIASYHLVGASFGAGVATELALTHPTRVRSLLLGPPDGSLLAELTPALRAFIEQENDALVRDDLDAAVAANVRTWAVGLERTEAEVDADVLASVRVMQRRAFEIAAEWGDVDEVELNPPALERLAELTMPLLVLVGGHDLDTTHDAANQVVTGVPQARRVDWPDVAHLPSMDEPEAFLALLLEWLSD